jgi:hypothetical protein
MWLFKLACVWTMNHDKYLNIYFYPWEFTDLKNPKYGLPKYVSRNSGSEMAERFFKLTEWLRKRNYTFATLAEFRPSGSAK